MAHDAPLNGAVEVCNRRLHILRAGSEHHPVRAIRDSFPTAHTKPPGLARSIVSTRPVRTARRTVPPGGGAARATRSWIPSG